MKNITRIAVDCMGGDYGPSVTVPASVDFLRQYPDTYLLLVGSSVSIETILSNLNDIPLNHIDIIPASEVVTMEDSIEVALRKKKNSSMRLAIQAVKDGSANACVSSGNTGALMAISRYILKTLDGIDRPAISTSIPNEIGRFTTMLDLGANADCSAKNLLQFAIMGAALSRFLENRENPSIGLLNIGQEIDKGNDMLKEAGCLLRSSPLNFYGNVEGNDIFSGIVDVIVCNGFIGNITLKSAEGLVKMLSSLIREEFRRNWLTSIVGILALPALNRLKSRIDNRRYNGATLLGLRGVVIKSHGSADCHAFGFALQRARNAILSQLLESTGETIHRMNQYMLEKKRANFAIG